MTQSAHRLQNLPPYVFVAIAHRIQELNAHGCDVIRLDIGSPDMPPPPHVIETLSQAACRSNTHGYAGYRGIPTFRQAVAAHYQKRFGVSLDPEREVLPLIGSKEGITNLALAYVDRGDCVLVPELGYPSYEMGARLAGGTAVTVPMPADNGYLLDFDAIDKKDAQRAKILWVNYPNNPTGALANADFYERAITFCQEHDLLLASDNPYVEICYDDNTAGSALQPSGARDHAVEFMSFSKTYNMAGWRLGAAVGNVDALRNLLTIKSNVDSGHFTAIYEAGIDALENTSPAWIKAKNTIYQARRDRLMATLPEIGLQATSPGGAMYIWAQALDMDGDTYTQTARDEALVSIAPGSGYGVAGTQYVRLSLGISDDRLNEAIDRLKQWYAHR